MSRYDFHPEAEVDLDEIWEFIARDSIDAADNVISEILLRLESLVLLPHHGHLRSDLTSKPLRFLQVYQYLIAYAPEEKPVWVLAVLHGRRNPRIIAAILKGRQ